MKCIFFIMAAIATIVFTVPLYGQTDSTWTLQQCIRAATQNAPRLQASMRSADAAAAAAREAAANRWPTVGLSGAYNYTSETQAIEIPIPPVPKRISFGDGNMYDFAATARVPLYAGGALAEKAQADAYGQSAAASDLRVDSLRLVYDVRRAYFAVLGSDARTGAAHQSVRRLARHLEELIAAQHIGAATEENRIAALARLRQAEQTALSAEADSKAALLALNNLIAQPGTEIYPNGNLQEPLADSSLLLLPLASRAEFRAAQARVDQSRRLARSAGGALLPSLSGSAAYHYGKPGVDMAANEWMNYNTLGLTASWTLWDWKARSHRVEQVRATADALDQRKQDLINSLNTRYETSLTALTAARLAEAKALERADLEQQRLGLVEGRLLSGMASESEYLDAHDDLTAAVFDRVSATVKLRLAETDFLYSAGY